MKVPLIERAVIAVALVVAGVSLADSIDSSRAAVRVTPVAPAMARAEHYGGWARQGVSGHSCGHNLSACLLGYAATGDRAFLERTNYVVSELAGC